MKVFRNNNFLFFILLIIASLLYLSSLFFEYDVWWDSAVYLGMGKYIFSLGEAGLFEASRPLVLPLFLGFFWKIGFDALLFGKIITILSSIGIIILVYIISNELFNRTIALISSVLLSFFPVFFLFSNIVQTEILSTCFMLLGVYFFIKNKLKFSGFFLGIAFMTRFFQIFAAIAILAILAYNIMNKKNKLNDVLLFLIFFLLPVMPYLVLSYYLYSNPLFPFYLQYWMTQNTGWVFNEPFYYYFINLFKENFLTVFSIAGLYYAIKNYKNNKKVRKNENIDKNGLVIAALFLFLFLPYLFMSHKEMRLIIPALPFISIMASIGIFHFINSIKKNKNIKNIVLCLLLIVFFIIALPKLKFSNYDDDLDVFYSYIDDVGGNSGIWVSNPAFIAYSDKKAEIIYYPLYSSERMAILEDNLENAKHILINTCDILPCNPVDSQCEKNHNEFISKIRSEFNTELDINKNNCVYYIFSRV